MKKSLVLFLLMNYPVGSLYSVSHLVKVTYKEQEVQTDTTFSSEATSVKVEATDQSSEKQGSQEQLSKKTEDMTYEEFLDFLAEPDETLR